MPHFDALAMMTQDPRVPADECWNANAEVWRQFGSQLEYSNIEEVRRDVVELLADSYRMEKAMRLEPYASGPPSD